MIRGEKNISPLSTPFSPTTLNFIVRYIFDFTIVQPFIEYRYYNLWIYRTDISGH